MCVCETKRIDVLRIVDARAGGRSRRHHRPVDEVKGNARGFRKLLEVPPVSRRERDLTRHSHRRNQNVTNLPAPAPRCSGPDVGRYGGGVLVEGKHHAVGDEHLKGLELTIERLAGAKGCPITSEAFEHGDGGYCQSPELGQVVQCMRLDDAVSRLSSDSVSVSSTTGSDATGLAIRLPELSGQQAKIGGWDIGKAGRCQRENVSWARSYVNVPAVMPTQQRDNLPLEAPPASVSVCGQSVTQCGGKSNRAGNRCGRGRQRRGS